MTKKKAISDKPVYQEFNRMDAIGQNGNDGTHYDLIGDDKIQRLMNLVVKHNRDAQNEPVMDAFKDLSVYGIIAQIVDNGKWGK